MVEADNLYLPDFVDQTSKTVIFILALMITIMYRIDNELSKEMSILMLLTIVVLNSVLRYRLQCLFSSRKPKSIEQQQFYEISQDNEKLKSIIQTYMPHIPMDRPFPPPQLRTFNIVFIDLKNFTQFSANSTLATITKLVNQFYSTIQAKATSYNGIISSYLGDGAMLLFEDTQDAVDCVNEIIKELPEPLTLCAGLHKGQLAFGCFGEGHCSYTAIGDAVNTASRVESSTRVLNCEFLCTDSVSLENMRYVGTVEAKGKGPIDLYQVCEIELARICKEIDKLERMMKFEDAADLAGEAAQKYPEDEIIAQKYRENSQRARQYQFYLPDLEADEI